MALPGTMRPPNDFRFDEPEGRPFRTISIETEADGKPADMAQGLYKHGVIGTDRQMPYGWSPEDSNHPHVAFFKFDNSVTAGELVFDRVDLTNPVHAAALNNAMIQVRALEKGGKIAFNPNCGGHMHIDAHGMGFYDVLRSLILYGHLEEPIVRLAGAGKKYGHRTLFKGHDQANTVGTGYSNPVLKGPFRDVEKCYADLMVYGDAHHPMRMRGINLTIYAQCRCAGCGKALPLIEGKAKVTPDYDAQWMRYLKATRDNYRLAHGRAMQLSALDVQDMRESWEHQQKRNRKGTLDLKTCTCRQRQRTIEWRVWNSQSNPRIMYAWIALMQAVHAYTWRPPSDLKVYRKFEHLAPFDWGFTPYNKLSEADKSRAKDSIAWMFAELPLTALEKDALAYAYQRTPYKEWGKEFFQNRANEPYKAPPYPNTYKQTMARKTLVDFDALRKAQEGKKFSNPIGDDGPEVAPNGGDFLEDVAAILDLPPTYLPPARDPVEPRRRTLLVSPATAAYRESMQYRPSNFHEERTN